LSTSEIKIPTTNYSFNIVIIKYCKMNSNTHIPKLSQDVINQIKDFKPSYFSDGVGIKFPFYDKLTEEQKSLIDGLIPNEELREQYKTYGLCKECSQPNTGSNL
jgi:hypothetical protein